MKLHSSATRILIFIFTALLFFFFFTGEKYLNFLLTAKYLSYITVSILAITLLAMKKVNNLTRLSILILLFCLFGIFFPIHPSPLCAVTKAFTRYQIRCFIPPAMIVMAGAMTLLTIMGNKSFCGWICPLGCMQEIFFKLSRRIKKYKVPFSFTNLIRTLFFICFLIIVSIFTVNIYDFINPFELFHWHPQLYTLLIVSVVLLASLIYFRPFCAFLCPVGFLSWICEYISIFRIYKNEALCTHCNKCIKESPCNAIGNIISDKALKPDCYSCGKCIESCPEGALSFRIKNP